jgi:hypothetical protein
MNQRTTNYFTRRIGILEDKLNELFSPELNYYMDAYLSYCDESFVNLIVLLLQAEITKDIPLTNVDSDFFSNIDLYGKIGEQIKSNYHIRIMEYYFRRNKYLYM